MNASFFDFFIFIFWERLILSSHEQKGVNASVLLFWNFLVFFFSLGLVEGQGPPRVSFVYIIRGCSVKLLVTASPRHLHNSTSSLDQTFRTKLFWNILSPSLTHFSPYVTVQQHFKKWKRCFFLLPSVFWTPVDPLVIQQASLLSDTFKLAASPIFGSASLRFQFKIFFSEPCRRGEKSQIWSLRLLLDLITGCGCSRSSAVSSEIYLGFLLFFSIPDWFKIR